MTVSLLDLNGGTEQQLVGLLWCCLLVAVASHTNVWSCEGPDEAQNRPFKFIHADVVTWLLFLLRGGGGVRLWVCAHAQTLPLHADVGVCLKERRSKPGGLVPTVVCLLMFVLKPLQFGRFSSPF